MEDCTRVPPPPPALRRHGVHEHQRDGPGCVTGLVGPSRAPLVLSHFLGPLASTAAEEGLIKGLLRHKAQLQADDAAPVELPPELSFPLMISLPFV